jgi:glycosyltransferase involved in cell wall biosynthesis
MKTLIVSNSISGGGAEKSMRTINKELGKLGFDTTLICLNNSGNDIGSDREVILDRAWKSGVVSTFKNYRDFCKIIHQEEPKSIIVNCELPELFVALLPPISAQIFCVEHTSMPWAGRRLMGGLVRILLKARGAKWVTVNRNQKYIWPIRERANYIPNPVPTPITAIDKQGANRFVYLGRLRTEKGVTTILEAVAEAKTTIDIFGTGNLQEQLQQKFTRVAYFHGFHENAWNQIQQSQTLIVASEYEGDGIVIVEAILAGLPILLLDNKDLRRFQLPEINYFKDTPHLVEKLSMAISNPEQFRAPSEKRSEYKSERSIENVLEKWLQILG